MTKQSIIGAAITLAVACVAGTVMATAGEIKVMSSVAIKEAYLELTPAFERASEHKVTTLWVPTVDMMTRLKGEETVDLVIMAAPSIDELTRAGKIVAGSRVDIAKSGVGIAVRAGAPHPDVSSADALKRALLAAKSIAYSTGPSGVYLMGLFQRMGIADEISPKIKQIKGEPVGAVIARGDAEIGFQQVSELLPVKGIDFLGPLPAEIQQITVFAAGRHVAAKDPEAVKAFVKFLTAPAAGAVFKKAGMEPG
jgi:molybdate transport system substrate-binding protein